MKTVTLRVEAEKYDSLLEILKAFDAEILKETPKKSRRAARGGELPDHKPQSPEGGISSK